MALTTHYNSAAAGDMACGKAQVWTYTTTGNAYAVVATINSARMLGFFFTFAVTTNDLLVKIEVTKDNTNYYTLVEDFPAAKAASTSFGFQYAGQTVRLSVKPAVAAAHGTVAATLIFSECYLPPEMSWAFGYESLTITNAVAVPLTQATYDAARQAVITVEGNPVRVRWDGTDPTTAEGHLLSVGDTLTLHFSADIFKFAAIATGANATLKVTYSR
jgi:hypothetical protein